MVVGYLDIFVFEEFGFAIGPVVDGLDGVIKGNSWVCVADEIYRCEDLESEG